MRGACGRLLRLSVRGPVASRFDPLHHDRVRVQGVGGTDLLRIRRVEDYLGAHGPQPGDVVGGGQTERERNERDRVGHEVVEFGGVVVVVERTRLRRRHPEFRCHGGECCGVSGERPGIGGVRLGDEHIDAEDQGAGADVVDLGGHRLDRLVARGQHAQPAGPRHRDGERRSGRSARHGGLDQRNGEGPERAGHGVSLRWSGV